MLTLAGLPLQMESLTRQMAGGRVSPDLHSCDVWGFLGAGNVSHHYDMLIKRKASGHILPFLISLFG